MRIAIDARLNAYRQGGIPQYTRQLLAGLAEVAPEDQFISLQHRDQLRPLAIAPNVVRRTLLTPPHHRFEQWALPLELLLARPDVLHSPDFIAPLRRACPAVVTIHDLAFMHYPEILDQSASAYYGQVKTNAPRADAIIAVSEATRQDIAQFLDIPIEQIDVIYEAAAPHYTQVELREGEARVLSATPVAAKSFMLFVSTLEPRKNLPTLLQALRICLDRQPGAGYRLVVAGRRGWRDDAIFEAVRDLKLGDHVFFAGGVGQYDLRWLYNACRIYINPSLYEGFGLPLLEAMACGAPCLAAATSSLPEIGGQAAIYVPPLEPDVWADEIEALWDDEERRAELGRLGLARAQQFSWLRAARETHRVYRRAVEQVVSRPATLASTQPAPEPAEELEFAPVPRAEIAPGQPRPCLRCGTALQAGELQRGMLVLSGEPGANGHGLAPRTWACPRCGHVELVIDWSARPGIPADTSPAAEPGRVDSMLTLVPIELPAESLSDQPDQAGRDDVLPVEVLPEVVAEPAPVVDELIEVVAEPAPVPDELIEVVESAESPAGETESTPTQEPAAAAPDAAQEAAAEPPEQPDSGPAHLNGASTRQHKKPARAPREQPAAGANTPPTKRRQSRSKRKQTP